MSTAPTPAAKLAALDELRAVVEHKLLDAEEMAAAARVARRAHAERLSREDAAVIRIQLALLEGLRAELTGEAEGMPPGARQGAQDARSGAGKGDGAPDGQRPPTGGLPGPGSPP